MIFFTHKDDAKWRASFSDALYYGDISMSTDMCRGTTSDGNKRREKKFV